MLWGLQLEPGHMYTQTVGVPFLITMASLPETMKGKSRSTLTILINDVKYSLCHLVPNKVEQQFLNLNIAENEDVTFAVSGSNGIHLTGNYIIDKDEDPRHCGTKHIAKANNDIDDTNMMNSQPIRKDLKRSADAIIQGQLKKQKDVSSTMQVKKKVASITLEDSDMTLEQLIDQQALEMESLLQKPFISSSSSTPSAPPLSSAPEPGAPSLSSAPSSSSSSTSLSATLSRQMQPLHHQQTAPLKSPTPGRMKTEMPTATKEKSKPSNNVKSKLEKKLEEQQRIVQEYQQKMKDKKQTDQENSVVDEPKKKRPTKKATTDSMKNHTDTRRPSLNHPITPAASSSPMMPEVNVTNDMIPKIQPLNGIIMEDKGHGSGRRARFGDRIGIRYIGKRSNGNTFAQHFKSPPYEVTLGNGHGTHAWYMALLGMKLGGERQFTIQSNLAYQNNDLPPGISPNETLTFNVKLMSLPELAEQ